MRSLADFDMNSTSKKHIIMCIKARFHLTRLKTAASSVCR